MPRAAVPHHVAESDRLFRAMAADRAARPAPAPRDASALLADIAATLAAQEQRR